MVLDAIRPRSKRKNDRKLFALFDSPSGYNSQENFLKIVVLIKIVRRTVWRQHTNSSGASNVACSLFRQHKLSINVWFSPTHEFSSVNESVYSILQIQNLLQTHYNSSFSTLCYWIQHLPFSAQNLPYFTAFAALTLLRDAFR